MDRFSNLTVDSLIMRHALAQLRHKWSGSSLRHENSLHQLAPYIGKLKTSIARTLVAEYSTPGSTVLEPFSGSGSVALEAILQGRNVIASDTSAYAAALTRAKLFAPSSQQRAQRTATEFCRRAKRIARCRRFRIKAPDWVSEFFHPRTLAEVLTLARLLRREKHWFLLACLLGILHHQRPGFLSYPSSHLVPYLRRKKFPKRLFPKFYEYRDVEPRLLAKVARAYRRNPVIPQKARRSFRNRDIRQLRVSDRIDLLLTSPPYMNALDYGRDNRLRLWFLGESDYRSLDSRNCRTPEQFRDLMCGLATLSDQCLSRSGRVVLVIGEVRRGNRTFDTPAIVSSVFLAEGKFKLIDQLEDPVPDIRRSRRECAGTKREWILVYGRNRGSHGYA